MMEACSSALPLIAFEESLVFPFTAVVTKYIETSNVIVYVSVLFRPFVTVLQELK